LHIESTILLLQSGAKKKEIGIKVVLRQQKQEEGAAAAEESAGDSEKLLFFSLIHAFMCSLILPLVGIEPNHKNKWMNLFSFLFS
jgi:hypothetical protein